MDLMGGLFDRQGIGWKVISKGRGQWLDVQMEISDKWFPSGVHTGTTESQNGRGWKGPLGSSSPTLLPKQGHLQKAVEDLVQAGLEYLQ